jgi:nicotinamidase-related amidase
MKKVFNVLFMVTFLAVIAGGTVSADNSVIDIWKDIKAPMTPELQPVAIDPAVTALLILDIEQRTVPSRPRAIAIVPRVKMLLDWARKNGILVVYSTTPGVSPDTILPEVKPQPYEVVVAASVDKYFNTELEATLRARGITNLIITGVAAEGAVLGTTIGSVVRGFKVVLPVDCMASSEPFYEQYVVVHVLNAPGTRGNVAVTSVYMLSKKTM